MVRSATGHLSVAPTGATGRDVGAYQGSVDEFPEPSNGRNLAMLWTILIILAIVALVLFILGRVRGGRGA